MTPQALFSGSERASQIVFTGADAKLIPETHGDGLSMISCGGLQTSVKPFCVAVTGVPLPEKSIGLGLLSAQYAQAGMTAAIVAGKSTSDCGRTSAGGCCRRPSRLMVRLLLNAGNAADERTTNTSSRHDSCGLQLGECWKADLAKSRESRYIRETITARKRDVPAVYHFLTCPSPSDQALPQGHTHA